MPQPSQRALCKFLTGVRHSDCRGRALIRWKKEIPALVNVMEEKSIPADAGSWKRPAAASALMTSAGASVLPDNSAVLTFCLRLLGRSSKSLFL